MEGNKHFTQLGGDDPQREYQDKVDEFDDANNENPNLDPESVSKIKKAWITSLKSNLSWLDTYETNSNAKFALEKMALEKKQQEEATAAAAAEEIAKQEKASKKANKGKKQAVVDKSAAT